MKLNELSDMTKILSVIAFIMITVCVFILTVSVGYIAIHDIENSMYTIRPFIRMLFGAIFVTGVFGVCMAVYIVSRQAINFFKKLFEDDDPE